MSEQTLFTDKSMNGDLHDHNIVLLRIDKTLRELPCVIYTLDRHLESLWKQFFAHIHTCMIYYMVHTGQISKKSRLLIIQEFV